MKRILLGLAMLALSAAVFPFMLAAQSDAAGLFKSKCVLCHAEDGSGSSPSGKALKAKDLRSPEIQTKSDTEIAEVISKGRNKMPAFAQKLKPDQIQQLVAYVRQLAKK
jgi:mono/diheme cytochrome c family protein